MRTASQADDHVSLPRPPQRCHLFRHTDIGASTRAENAWGEPDLGHLTDETDVPLQRSQIRKSGIFHRGAARQLTTAIGADWLRPACAAHRSRRRRCLQRGVYPRSRPACTSRVVDPPNGRLPSTTAEAQKIAAAEREFRLALLQSTETCKNKEPACNGGKYDPTPSSRFEDLPPRYNTARINRQYGPEDNALAERCLTGGLPEFGNVSFRRIVQTPSGISIFYDVGQGQGWQRNIIMDGRPHLPSSIRQWYGDSRGRWEGDTLVIDVTNFSPKTDFQGSRENLHVVERWTRTSPTTLAYAVTVEDPTVWTRPWTAKQDFIKQSDQENRIYTEPRCIEGNYGLPGLLHGRRLEELAFAEGRGPHTATKDSIKASEGDPDPLQ
jgi:hypothetical protein